MSFAQFIHQPQPIQPVHKLFKLLPIHKGTHYLFSIPHVNESIKIISAAVADLLKADKTVLLYFNPDAKRSAFSLQVLSSLSGFSFQDLSNPNFIKKEYVQNKIKEIDEKYKHYFKVNYCSPDKIKDDIVYKLQFEHEYDAVFIQDLSIFYSYRNQEESFAHIMNRTINSFNNLSSSLNIPIVSFINGAGSEAEYLKNLGSYPIKFEQRESADLFSVINNHNKFQLKLLENFEYISHNCESTKEEGSKIHCDQTVLPISQKKRKEEKQFEPTMLAKIFKSQGYKISGVPSDFKHISFFARYNNLVTLVVFKNTDKIKIDLIEETADQIKKAVCQKGIIYTTALKIPMALYKRAKELGIELVDGEDLERQITLFNNVTDNKEFLLNEMKTWKNELNQELIKKDKDYNKIKTLGARISKCASDLIK